MDWQLNGLAELHWRQWNDEWVSFDMGSGQTHQMDSLTAVTLILLEEASATQRELELKVSKELQVPSSKELTCALGGVLERLATTGLIEIAS